MKPNPVHRLPAPLEAAVQAVKMAARSAAERTVESLGLAALDATGAGQRDRLLGAQFELNRKSVIFALAYDEAFDERVLRELQPQAGAKPAGQPTSWDALTLVDDSEVEQQIVVDRIALEITGACEWELRELDGYVATLLGSDDKDRNPLRPAIAVHAMIRAIDAVSDYADTRQVLRTEIGRSLGGVLPATYADIVASLRRAGVTPQSLAVRQRDARAASAYLGAGPETVGRPAEATRPREGIGSDPSSVGFDSRYGPRGSPHTWRGPGSAHGDTRGGRTTQQPAGTAGTPLGTIEPALMTLMRHLAYADAGAYAADGYGESGGMALPNVIRAHRDELRQASRGALDHIVIDVIGTLFDQILADPKVPPQLARQIARLQVPVLRAALGDPEFFASRKHPVRRFVNRIATLGAAFDTFGDEAAQSVVAKVRELVQEVVEGDFDQIETYEGKLRALEQFCDEISTRELAAQNAHAAELLAEKEDELRLRALYARRLEGDLRTVTAPEFVREFISRVWSQVLLRAAARHGADSDRMQRLRRAGSELFLSVQPKPTPAHRKVFLAELPKLMQVLTEGMDLIGWPDAERRAFFGRLMPAHAEALKGSAVRQLDLNLMARQVEGALDKALPSREELRGLGAAALPVLTDEIVVPRFTADEAARIGLVDEGAVNWQAPVAADPARRAEEAELEQAAAPLPPAAAAHAPPVLQALPAVAERAAPPDARALVGAVQVGNAYQMHLEGQWQKVRLTHVSAGRSFFVFTHGKRNLRTVSMTQRMLLKMGESGRFRNFEAAELLDRATLRARRQLAGLAIPPA